jgi:hypothetical protein
LAKSSCETIASLATSQKLKTKTAEIQKSDSLQLELAAN